MDTMRILLNYTIAMALLLLPCAALSQETGNSPEPFPRPIAVYVSGDVPNNEKNALGTYLLASLVNSGTCVSHENSAAFLAAVDEEQSKRKEPLDDSRICDIGKQFGIKYVCVAAIAPTFGFFTISARIINTEAGRSKFNGEAVSPLKTIEDLTQAANKVVENMFGRSFFGVQTEPEPTTPEQPGPEAEEEPETDYWYGKYKSTYHRYTESPARTTAYAYDDEKPSRPKHSVGIRVWGLGNDYPSPETYTRIGLGQYSRVYVGFGWNSGDGEDTIVAPYMTVNYDIDFDIYQFIGFFEWHAGNIASIHGGPGIVLSSYGLKSTITYNKEPIPIKISGSSVDFGLQGGAELKLSVFVIGANMRLAYGLHTYEVKVNDKVSQRETIPELTCLFGLNFEIRF
jgi:hypothetical protein